MNLKFLNCVILGVFLSLPPSHAGLIKLNSILMEKKLLKMPTSSVFLTLANSTSSVLSTINSLPFASDTEKAFVMMEALKAHADVTQMVLREFLTLAGFEFTSYWITNQIHIKEAIPPLLLELTSLFSGNIIASIMQEVVLPMLSVLDEGVGIKPQAAGQEWGQKMMNVQSAWDNGMKGKGTRVMVMDTGVRATHQEFKGKKILWHDPILNTKTPNDLNGHGTHVCGTIAGDTVGIAPEATLQCCKCCDTAGCTQEALTSCAQFTCCPDPSNKCSQKPHIVSNSWGGGGGNPFFADCVKAWHTADVKPIFALGNSGPGCGTAGSPGDYDNVIGVGAVNEKKAASDFSSRGPAKTGSVTKPEVAAPGEAINSASHLSDSGYRKLSGTSMACPHVSGMSAVILTGGKQMTYNELVQTLKSSCSHDLTSSGVICSDKSDSSFPNYVYGNGIPNCGAAVKNMKLKEQQKTKGQSKDSFEDFDTEGNDSFEDFDTEDTEDENNAEEESDFETDDD